MASGELAQAIKGEFLRHSREEQQHADRLAERIVQLGGAPNFDPHARLERSHSQYADGESLADMVEEDLIAERIAIQSYREIIQYIGDKDATTRCLFESILSVEEVHAEELASMRQDILRNARRASPASATPLPAGDSVSYALRSFDLSGVQGLSKKALDLHLGLYKGYIENLNKLLEQPKGGSPLALDGYNRRFAFEYNGVKLHELFFEQLAGRRRAPSTSGEWSAALKSDFGDFNGWKTRIGELAETRGVGWVMTLRERGGSKLHNVWVDLHHLHMPADSQIVFVLDVWEHAFMIRLTPVQTATM